MSRVYVNIFCVSKVFEFCTDLLPRLSGIEGCGSDVVSYTVGERTFTRVFRYCKVQRRLFGFLSRTQKVQGKVSSFPSLLLSLLSCFVEVYLHLLSVLALIKSINLGLKIFNVRSKITTGYYSKRKRRLP